MNRVSSNKIVNFPSNIFAEGMTGYALKLGLWILCITLSQLTQFTQSCIVVSNKGIVESLRGGGGGPPVRTRSVIERTGSVIRKKDLQPENASRTLSADQVDIVEPRNKSSSVQPGEKPNYSPIIARRHTRLDDVYKIDYGSNGVLGTGTFSTVRIAVCRLTGLKYAVKSISLENIQAQTLVRLRREIQVLRSLRHNNIIRLYEIFEEDGFLHMVTELCTGGELWHFLQKVEIFPDGEKFYHGPNGRVELTESTVASIIRGIVDAISYCHGRNICHRDLKLENLMLSRSGDQGELKLIDFGFCKIFNSQDGMFAILGSPYYVAPEILKAKAPSAGGKPSGYGPAADMWSIGVITYMILCGQAPFDGETDQMRLTAVRRGIFNYPPNARLSAQAVSFIDGLLTVDPFRRLDANAALQHPWLRGVRPTGRSEGWQGLLPAQSLSWTLTDML